MIQFGGHFFFTTSQEIDTYRGTVKSDLSFLLLRRGREIKWKDGFVSLTFLVSGERCVVVFGGLVGTSSSFGRSR